MLRNGGRPDALIETLHTIQSSFGFLDEAALMYVSESLAVSPATVYGVATFYHYFQLKPQGRHACAVCTGTACYIKGSDALLDSIREHFGITPGETTADGALSLLTVRCLGACGLAPAAVLDGGVLGNVTAENMHERLQEAIDHDNN